MLLHTFWKKCQLSHEQAMLEYQDGNGILAFQMTSTETWKETRVQFLRNRKMQKSIGFLELYSLCETDLEMMRVRCIEKAERCAL